MATATGIAMTGIAIIRTTTTTITTTGITTAGTERRVVAEQKAIWCQPDGFFLGRSRYRPM
jgi:hypothetical protein